MSSVGFQRSVIASGAPNGSAPQAPERERKTAWKEFLAQHWGLIVEADFFTIEAWTRRGLPRFVILFFMGTVDPQGLAKLAVPNPDRCVHARATGSDEGAKF